MGLKVGERMHLVGIDENTPIFLQKNNYKHNFSYMYEVFILWDTNLVLLQYYQNTTYIHNYGLFQHFCNVFVAYCIIAISNFH
jgi:hypothetical protein